MRRLLDQQPGSNRTLPAKQFACYVRSDGQTLVRFELKIGMIGMFIGGCSLREIGWFRKV